MGGRREQTFLQRRHTNGQWTHEKMLNVTRHRGNEYKSKPQWDIISHQSEWLKWTSQETTDVGRDAEEGNPLTLLVGTQAGMATLENSMEVPQKVENRATLGPSNCISGYLPQRYKCSDLKGPPHPNVYSSNAHNSQTQKEPRCSSTDEWIRKMWYTYTMEYYSAIKKKSCHLQWHGWN